MSKAKEHYDRFQELPRSMQWVALAAIFLFAFLIWAKLIQPTAQGWSDRADQIEVNLQRLKGESAVPSDIRNAAIGFGDLKLPDRKQQGSLQLAQHVQQLLESRGIKNDSFTMQRPTPISASKSSGLTPGNEKLERLKVELDFQSKPSVAADIISEMESDPAIEAISAVKLDREENGVVRVRLTLESWVRAGRGGRGR
ncbi:MAG: hypothetical protein VX527_11625 [Planctomycetota bacterium]|nr:hypothetical protein [Planctomycetota bacterium]